MKKSRICLAVVIVLLCLPVSGQNLNGVPYVDKKDADGQLLSRTFILLNSDTLIKEGHDLYRKGQREAALEKFQIAAKASPVNIDAHYCAAVLCLQLGRLSKAETAYDKIRELIRFFSGVGRGLYKDRLARAIKAQKLLEQKMQKKSADLDFAEETASLNAWFKRVEQCQGIVLRPSVACASEK